MSKQVISLTKHFNAPVNVIFAALSDHERFGEIISANIRRVVDSQSGNVNGLGSVRLIRIAPGPIPGFEETITDFQPNELIEYRITKGGPLQNHVGTMRFRDDNGKTRLDYRIEFEPKLSVPLLGGLIKRGLSFALSRGLDKFAKQF